MEQRIKDAMAETRIEFILKRLQSTDIELLETIQQRGAVSYEYIRGHDQYKQPLIRCKARSLVIPIRKGTVYWYDITDLGLEALQVLRDNQQQTAQIKQKTQRI